MNKFLMSENKGRKLLEDMLLSVGVKEADMFPSIGEYNPVDYFFRHNDRRFCVEIKVRDVKFIDSETHFFEQKKEDAMLLAMKEHKCTDAIYVNFFGDDTCVIYNIKNTGKYRRSIVTCNKTTAIKSNKIKKVVIECPSIEGVWLKKSKTDNKWHFIDANVKKNR